MILPSTRVSDELKSSLTKHKRMTTSKTWPQDSLQWKKFRSALTSFFVIVVTYGQKVTNINKFSHSKNFFSVYLFCFVSLPNSLSVSYACALITLIHRGDSSEDHHCYYFDFTITLFCFVFFPMA